MSRTCLVPLSDNFSSFLRPSVRWWNINLNTGCCRRQPLYYTVQSITEASPFVVGQCKFVSVSRWSAGHPWQDRYRIGLWENSHVCPVDTKKIVVFFSFSGGLSVFFFAFHSKAFFVSGFMEEWEIIRALLNIYIKGFIAWSD